MKLQRRDKNGEKIFISYVWDEKVVDLVEMLEEYKELNIKFDKWHVNKGQELPHFVNRNSTIRLCISNL
ncbi:TIR domain-containing protein [Staphylococcus sp. MI 10-1553]|uniref:hypothetical protein n=1 Tax=Staphylococcus sp. MI 10-1553 TaxID=1912064 RepID=UPI001EF03C73|nr:hypothetical protein [Staphylococcus sp. MI 10-1553]